MITEAFFEVCNRAKPATGHFVSLYVTVPFYGGPEEGGWWGSDTLLIAYQQATYETADTLKAEVDELAAELTKDAKRSSGEHCLRQTEWLEQRGLDDSFLPEPDGETKYAVIVETSPGSQESRGCRHYE